MIAGCSRVFSKKCNNIEKQKKKKMIRHITDDLRFLIKKIEVSDKED